MANILGKASAPSTNMTLETVVLESSAEELSSDYAMPVLGAVWSMAGRPDTSHQGTQSNSEQTKKPKKRRKYKKTRIYPTKAQRRMKNNNKSKKYYTEDSDYILPDGNKQKEILRQQMIDIQREREIEKLRKVEVEVIKNRERKKQEKKQLKKQQKLEKKHQQRLDKSKKAKLETLRENLIKDVNKKMNKLQYNKHEELKKQKELEFEREIERIDYELELQREREIDRLQELHKVKVKRCDFNVETKHHSQSRAKENRQTDLVDHRQSIQKDLIDFEEEIQRQKETNILKQRMSEGDSETESADSDVEIVNSNTIVIDDDDSNSESTNKPNPMLTRVRILKHRNNAMTDINPQPYNNHNGTTQQLQQEMNNAQILGPLMPGQQHIGIMTSPGVIQIIGIVDNVSGTKYINNVENNGVIVPTVMNNVVMPVINSAVTVNSGNNVSVNGGINNAPQIVIHNGVVTKVGASVDKVNTSLNNGISQCIKNGVPQSLNKGMRIVNRNNQACLEYEDQDNFIQSATITRQSNDAVGLQQTNMNIVRENITNGAPKKRRRKLINNDEKHYTDRILFEEDFNGMISEDTSDNDIIIITDTRQNTIIEKLTPTKQNIKVNEGYLSQYVKDFKISNVTIDEPTAPLPYQMIPSGNQTVALTKVGGHGTTDRVVDWEDQIPMDVIALVDTPII